MFNLICDFETIFRVAVSKTVYLCNFDKDKVVYSTNFNNNQVDLYKNIIFLDVHNDIDLRKLSYLCEKDKISIFIWNIDSICCNLGLTLAMLQDFDTYLSFQDEKNKKWIDFYNTRVNLFNYL